MHTYQILNTGAVNVYTRHYSKFSMITRILSILSILKAIEIRKNFDTFYFYKVIITIGLNDNENFYNNILK